MHAAVRKKMKRGQPFVFWPKSLSMSVEREVKHGV